MTGAFSDANRTGAPISVMGSGGIEHQVQDNLSGRATYDLTPAITAAYTFGLFYNDDDSTVNSYLRDPAGQAVYAGAVNIGGRAYTVANSAFSSNLYSLQELELAQGLSLASHTDGVFDSASLGSPRVVRSSSASVVASCFSKSSCNLTHLARVFSVIAA